MNQYRRSKWFVYLLAFFFMADHAVGEGAPPGMSGNKKVATGIINMVSLKDVHPLYGGHNLFLHGNGEGVVQVVTFRQIPPGFSEKRYRITLPPEEMAHLAQVIEIHSFFHISLKERPGLPNEARPTISVRLTSGKSLSLSKWFRDKQPDFDALYQILIDVARSVQGETPVYDGEYDRSWVPDGFSS